MTMPISGQFTALNTNGAKTPAIKFQSAEDTNATDAPVNSSDMQSPNITEGSSIITFIKNTIDQIKLNNSRPVNDDDRSINRASEAILAYINDNFDDIDGGNNYITKSELNRLRDEHVDDIIQLFDSYGSPEANHDDSLRVDVIDTLNFMNTSFNRRKMAIQFRDEGRSSIFGSNPSRSDMSRGDAEVLLEKLLDGQDMRYEIGLMDD